MQPVRRPRPILTQRLARARQVPQVPDRRWWHETPPHEAVLQQVRDPDAVLHVRLATGDLGNVRGVRQHAGHRLFEDIEHRFPVARPETLRTSFATEASLIPACSRTLCNRLAARVRF